MANNITVWNLSEYSSNTALRDDRMMLTYSELEEFCSVFKSKVGERCLIFILGAQCVECAAGYIASINNGIVPLVVDEKMDRELFDKLVATYSPKYFWIPKNLNLHEYETVFSYNQYILVKTGNKGPAINDDLALLLTTSGSTGSNKLVRLSYKNIISNTNSICSYLEIKSDDRAILVLPLHYTYGLSVLNTHILKGGEVVFTEKRFYTADFWQYAKEIGVTSFAGVPYHYETLYKTNMITRIWDAVETFTCAGGKLDKKLVQQYAEQAENNHRRFFVMYGQTEATARISYLPYNLATQKAGSVGIGIPGMRIELVNDNDELITQPNKEGNIICYGENIFMGYATAVNDLSEASGPQRLETHDRGYFDEDGYLYLCGRNDRYVKIYGSRVSLDELEDILKQEYKTNEIICCKKDERIVIIIYGVLCSENDIKKYLGEKTGFPHSTFEVKNVVDIPRLSNGKINYVALMEHINSN